eukprot:TRINITY_DN1446_c0_g1_i2.p1 TRINITY_DN1446_c0_g1~~TRINITY_DN1446_c0_g1_i2.p1  ORF type:complete len:242 (+),score=34.78 TRINITY_DN1446_c0_g1_i2:62-787(+)
MAMRAAMQRAAPLLRTSFAGRTCTTPQLKQLMPRNYSLATIPPTSPWKPETRAIAAAFQARSAELPKQAGGITGGQTPLVGGVRAMSTWRLRPYAAAAGAGAMLPLSSLSAGFSKVGLSLLVLPWKALPMALALLPCVWVLPAMNRMIFQNSMRATTASVFNVILYLVLSFMPVPCFENLFSELTFYGIALVSTFFMYTFFPEVLLHDFMFMHYLALFTIPLIPLAFAYMPMFASRAYLFL